MLLLWVLFIKLSNLVFERGRLPFQLCPGSLMETLFLHTKAKRWILFSQVIVSGSCNDISRAQPLVVVDSDGVLRLLDSRLLQVVVHQLVAFVKDRFWHRHDGLLLLPKRFRLLCRILWL